jgi:hypothetical protein
MNKNTYCIELPDVAAYKWLVATWKVSEAGYSFSQLLQKYTSNTFKQLMTASFYIHQNS